MGRASRISAVVGSLTLACWLKRSLERLFAHTSKRQHASLVQRLAMQPRVRRRMGVSVALGAARRIERQSRGSSAAGAARSFVVRLAQRHALKTPTGESEREAAQMNELGEWERVQLHRRPARPTRSRSERASRQPFHMTRLTISTWLLESIGTPLRSPRAAPQRRRRHLTSGGGSSRAGPRRSCAFWPRIMRVLPCRWT